MLLADLPAPVKTGSSNENREEFSGSFLALLRVLPLPACFKLFKVSSGVSFSICFARSKPRSSILSPTIFSSDENSLSCFGYSSDKMLVSLRTNFVSIKGECEAKANLMPERRLNCLFWSRLPFLSFYCSNKVRFSILASLVFANLAATSLKSTSFLLSRVCSSRLNYDAVLRLKSKLRRTRFSVMHSFTMRSFVFFSSKSISSKTFCCLEAAVAYI